MTVTPPAPRPAPRRGIWGWVGRIAFLLVALAAAGAIYQAIATVNDRSALPPPGMMVDVGGHRLHILCMGNAAPGGPTVILEAGTAGSSPAWALVQTALAPTMRACAYDRAGNGWSEVGPAPRDGRAIVGDLHALLAAAQIEGPYILAGHSFGGLYIRAYRDVFPDEVVGMVLVDSSHPDQFARSPKRSGEIAAAMNILRLAPWLAHVGLLRLTGLAEGDAFDLPPKARAELSAFAALPGQARTARAELSAFSDLSARLHDAAGLGDLPLEVLSAGKDAEADWPALQAELATLSTNSRAVTIPTANHASLLMGSAGAAEVTAAIRAVAQAALTGGRFAD